jgi:hypothetical protein
LRGDWTRSGDHLRTTTIHVIELLAVFGGRTLMLNLRAHGRCPRATEGCDLSGLRTGCDTTTAPVIGYAGGIVNDDGSVINVSDVDVYSINRTVVVKGVSVPIAAVIAETGVTEAVVDASVEADVSAPVAAVEAPTVVVPAPIAGGPEGPVIGREAPGAGDPVVTCRRPVPVTRGPDVVRPRSFGLVVFGEGRRRLISVFNRLRLAFCV